MPRGTFFGSPLTGNGIVLPTVRNLPELRRARHTTVCALTDKGRSISAEHIQVRGALGEGTFGQVFEVINDLLPLEILLKLAKVKD